MRARKKDVKNQCLEVISQDVKFVASQDKRAYAIFYEEDGRKHVVLVRSQEFLHRIRLMITKLFIPTIQLLIELQEHIEAICLYESPERHISTRFLRRDGGLLIDKSNAKGEAIKITGNNIKVLESYKTLFYRPVTQEPIEDYKLDGIKNGCKKFRKYIGKTEVSDFRLLISWIVAVICTNGPYPILLFQGEQGSAKTSTMRIISNLIDPSNVPIKVLPSSEEDFFVVAQNNPILAFDNISKISQKMSDVLCQAVSGVAHVKRKKYTDSEQIAVKVQPAMMFNGIPDFANSSDLADRILLIQMKTIPEDERKTEAEIDEEFNKDKPEILGAIYQAVSKAIANRNNVECRFFPRMADFAKIGCAVAPALGWSQDDFLMAYLQNIEVMSEKCFEEDEVAMISLEFIQEAGKWAGSASDLQAELLVLYSTKITRKDWPNTPSSLSSRLRIAAPSLRKKGVEVRFKRTNKKRIICLEYMK